jgi:hypothetical protein
MFVDKTPITQYTLSPMFLVVLLPDNFCHLMEQSDASGY